MDPKVRKEALLQYLFHMQRVHLHRRLKTTEENCLKQSQMLKKLTVYKTKWCKPVKL